MIPGGGRSPNLPNFERQRNLSDAPLDAAHRRAPRLEPRPKSVYPSPMPPRRKSPKLSAPEQMPMPKLLTPAEIDALRRDLREGADWGRQELARRRIWVSPRVAAVRH
jgi:hypothetical protein